MRSCVTISLVEEARGGPFVFWDDVQAGCRRAAELGFDAVEIFPPSADALDVPALGRLLDHLGLKLAAVGTGAGWVKHRRHLTLSDSSARAEARAFIRTIIDVAGSLGAPAIIGSMQGRWSDDVPRDEAWDHLRDALDDLGRHAEQYQVPLLYEPLNRYETNMATTVAAALAQLERLSTPNVKLLCDLFHMNIEETDIAAALLVAGQRVGHVHFVDSNRRAAGFGHLDFAPIVAALRRTAYRGYLSAEALPWPTSDIAAQQTIAAFREHCGSTTSPA